VLATSLLVVHDTGRGGEHDVAELTRGKQLDNPLLQVTELDVVARADDTSLVEAIVAAISYGSNISQTKKGTYRPLSWTTILPLRWSSISSNSPM
jgi:nitrogen regulatory protein PII